MLPSPRSLERFGRCGWRAICWTCPLTGREAAAIADLAPHLKPGDVVVRRGPGRGHAEDRDGPGDGAAGQGRGQLLPRHQDLVHLQEVDSINMRRRVRMVDLAREVCGGSIVGRRIAVLGASFKPESDDVRDSPALSVAAQMQLQGAKVRVTDPRAIENARKKWPDLTFAEIAQNAYKPHTFALPTAASRAAGSSLGVSCCSELSGRARSTHARPVSFPRSSAASC